MLEKIPEKARATFQLIKHKLRKWFRFPERLVIFTFGLLFSKGIMTFVLDNLITFLTDFWNLKLKKAAIIVNLREGLTDMLQICTALCIDACLGYRWMLILSSVLYSAGFALLSFSVPEYFFNGEVCPLDEVHCFKRLKHTPFWEGFALLIAGGAAQAIPLNSLSFDQTKVVKVPEHCEATRVKAGCCSFKVKIGGWRQLQQRFIRWFCNAFMMMGLITYTIYGLIYFYSRWHQRFLVSAVAIAIGLLWFLCGFTRYGPPRLQPSPLSTMLRVLIAAVRKRHLNHGENLYQLHRGDGDDQNQPLTDHLECLNNAAVKESPVDDNLKIEETRWKLCTVKEVEQTKVLLNIIPMSLTFIVYGMVKSLGNTFFIEQANSIRYGFPIVVFQTTQWLSKYLVKWVYKKAFEKRINRIKRRYSDGVKIGIGMLSTIICCAVASSVESKRLKSLSQEHLSNVPDATAPISAFWFVLQYFLLGAMEGLAGDGIQDFFGHYAPSRYVPVFTSSVTGYGTVLNIGFIAILEYYSKSRYNESWLGDTVNQSHLDYIYRAYVIVALLNCFLYAYISTQYSYDNIIGRPEEEEEEEIPFLEVNEEETEAGDQQNNQGQGEIELTGMP